MIYSLIINPKDSVAVVTSPAVKGDVLDCTYDGKSMCKVTALEDIPPYHKVAIKDIAKDEKVLKYGEPIGVALSVIKVGMHVHTHNIISECLEEEAAK